MSDLPDTGNCLFDKTLKKTTAGSHFQEFNPTSQSIDPTLMSNHAAKGLKSAVSAPRGLDHSEESLKRLSARPYSVRVSDPDDFAHVWETTLVPLFTNVLESHCDGDFSVDVHNFPELDGGSVPCVIFVSLPVVASSSLQERIRAVLAPAIPRRFHQTHIEFRQGTFVQSTWWGTDKDNVDSGCSPQNNGFQAVPTNGASVGPRSSTEAGTLGGFVKAGDKLYGMSCRHVFEEAISKKDPRVVHPGPLDLWLNEGNDPNARQLDMGELFCYSEKYSTRQSFTYQGTGHSGVNHVEMDWCLFGPVPEGKNILFTTCFGMDRLVTVDTFASIEANTKVYAIGRTSGYSLGFTSGVPGIIRMKGILRREWTVRRFYPSSRDRDTHLDLRWQTLREWVTRGIGVSGDSGSWLMRCEDNAVVGLVWARNVNRGSPVERVRLTYVTPFVDILNDIKEKSGLDATLPSYSTSELRYEASQARYTMSAQSVLATGHPSERTDTPPSNSLLPLSADEHVNPVTLRDHWSVDDFQGGVSHPQGATTDDISVHSADTFVTTDSVNAWFGTGDEADPGEEILRGIGAIADDILGPPTLVLPDLDSDTGSAYSEPSIMSLDEPQVFNGDHNVQFAVQDDSAENDSIVDVDDPVRSKATSSSGLMQPSLLVPRSRLFHETIAPWGLARQS
jgi:hypothetical protein